MSEQDLSILKYYREGNELCGFERVHESLCRNGYLDSDLELTIKGREFIRNYPDWGNVAIYENKTHITI